MKTIKFYVYGVSALIAVLFIGYQFHIYNLKKSVQKDIDFIHQKILQNHPGPYNDQDPDFVKNMNKAYLGAQNSIAAIRSLNQHKNIIKEYLATFHDTHVRMYSKVSKKVDLPVIGYKNFSSKKLADDIVWITLPTFAPSKEQQLELEAIIDQKPKYKTSNLIVFDVRNNTGGSSAWGTRIVQNLFGKEYVTQKLYEINKNIKIDWRASKDNTDYLTSLIDSIKNQYGLDSAEVLEFQIIQQGMQDAYKHHKSFYTEHGPVQKIEQIQSKNSVTAKIVVITSSNCVSACLDFIDEIKAMDPQAIIIGDVTDADSVYMEVRTLDLPSNIGTLQFPIKVYRNRPRGHNVPYIPDIAYPATINSAEAKDQWLLEMVQKLSMKDKK